jgi:hypothetical protein
MSRPSMNESRSGWHARVRLVPRTTRLQALVLLGCAAAPGVARLYAILGEAALAGVLREHLDAVSFVALGLGCLVVLAVERPRSASPTAYVRQLRSRLVELQSIFDAGLRRRPGEGKENGHDPHHP